MARHKSIDVPLPTDVVEKPRPKPERPSLITHTQIYKTINEINDWEFDRLVNNAIREDWHLDRRFVNVKTGNFVAFMSQYVPIEELEEYNEE